MDNVSVIRGIYDAFGRGDVASVLSAMSPDIEWNEAENFPYADGNPYIGPEAVANGVFARCGSEWDGFAAAIDEILDAGSTIVALGRYTGVYRTTGKPIRAQLAHVWRVEGGKAIAFQQYVDTLQVAEAIQ